MIQPSVLRNQAEVLLQKAPYNSKKLVLIHTAITTGSLLLTNLLSYLFSLLIAQTGGLSGMGLRSSLATMQSVLEFGTMLALPFWEMGLLFAALRWAKEETPTPVDLPEGFRRFGSVLGLRFLQTALFFILAITIFNISYMIFLFTPFANPLLSQLEPLLQQATSSEMLFTEEFLASIGESIVPLFVIFGVFYALVAIPLFYRMRFSEFSLMEGSRAVKSLLESLKITKKRCLQLVRIDLSFWWFYLLQALTIAIGYGDSLLAAFGVTLPLSQGVQFLLFSILSLLSQGLLIWLYQDVVLTTYCLTYRTFSAPIIPTQTAEISSEM